MELNRIILVATSLWMGCAGMLWAGEATTSANAGSRGGRSGWAAATANYDGNGPGYATTRTRTGNVNIAQGVAVGFDNEGLSFSTSYAVAPRLGPAVAGTFNVNIGLNGQVATSVGRTIASGDPVREVTASGGTGRTYGGSPAWATTGGTTGPAGTVKSFTKADSSPAPGCRLPAVVALGGRSVRG